MSVNITTKGFIGANKTLGKPLAPVLTRAVFEATAFMQRTATANQTRVIYNRPVPWKRTGKLRQNTVGESAGNRGRVYVGVDYGKAVEFGRPGRSRAYPYFVPAIEATKKQIPVILAGLLKKHYAK